MRNLRYSFTLAHVPDRWKHHMGGGVNFLIDQQGRIVFRLHFAGREDLRKADRLIAGLLRVGSLAR